MPGTGDCAGGKGILRGFCGIVGHDSGDGRRDATRTLDKIYKSDNRFGGLMWIKETSMACGAFYAALRPLNLAPVFV